MSRTLKRRADGVSGTDARPPRRHEAVHVRPPAEGIGQRTHATSCAAFSDGSATPTALTFPVSDRPWTCFNIGAPMLKQVQGLSETGKVNAVGVAEPSENAAHEVACVLCPMPSAGGLTCTASCLRGGRASVPETPSARLFRVLDIL